MVGKWTHYIFRSHLKYVGPRIFHRGKCILLGQCARTLQHDLCGGEEWTRAIGDFHRKSNWIFIIWYFGENWLRLRIMGTFYLDWNFIHGLTIERCICPCPYLVKYHLINGFIIFWDQSVMKHLRTLPIKFVECGVWKCATSLTGYVNDDN